MKRLVCAALLLLAVAAFVPALSSHAQGAPLVSVNSQYVVNRYGYAIINETIKLTNNESTPLQIPDFQLGFGNLSSSIMSYNVTGTGYSVSQSSGAQGQLYAVSGGGQQIPAGASSTVSFKALTDSIVSRTKNGTLGLDVPTRPYIGLTANSLKLLIKMPASTQFKAAPPGYKESFTGTNVTYYKTLANASPQPPLTGVLLIQQYTQQDFFPLEVYSADRLITISANGNPVVQDSISFKNMGTTRMTTLFVDPLTSPNAQIVVLASASPPLLNPATLSLSNRGIYLAGSAVGLTVDAGANLTITYQYPLAQKYYNVTGGVVNLAIPTAPPIAAYVNSYTVKMSLPPGVTAVSGSQQTLSNVAPFQQGTARFSYGLSVGWGLNVGVPIASFIFVLVLIGLFAARTTGMGTEEEEEAETATESTSDMVKAFEEKTSLINGLFEEIPTVDPNDLNKAYFDELRGRLDTFRSRALQRLNEMKQKSTTQKFFDLLGQIHETEREVDRAAKDMLNLYEQFYTRRMRKEVFDRLLPNYKRRLEKALNQLSDELNVAQREAKTL
ncbi:MAG: hypothetical protein LYZ69_06905 [Nitrososphaerales archaeon]|nr:hypothetical protein [Nitrososphaerales archaeon]